MRVTDAGTAEASAGEEGVVPLEQLADHVDRAIPARDLAALTRAAADVKTWVDKHVAHWVEVRADAAAVLFRPGVPGEDGVEFVADVPQPEPEFAGDL